MSGEYVNGLLMPQDPGDSHALPHEDLAVKPPEVAAMGEGNESGVYDGELGEDGQARTADGKQEACAARVDTFIRGGEWHSSRYNFIILFVPQLLQ